MGSRWIDPDSPPPHGQVGQQNYVYREPAKAGSLAPLLWSVVGGLLAGGVVVGGWALGIVYSRKDRVTEAINGVWKHGPEVLAGASGVVRSVTDLVSTATGHVDRFAEKRQAEARQMQVLQQKHDLDMQRAQAGLEQEKVRQDGKRYEADRIAEARKITADAAVEVAGIRATKTVSLPRPDSGKKATKLDDVPGSNGISPGGVLDSVVLSGVSGDPILDGEGGVS